MGGWDYSSLHLTQWSQEALIKFVKSHGFEVIVRKIRPVDGWEIMLQLNIMSVLLSPLAVFFSLLGNEGSHQYVMLKREVSLTPSRTNT